MIAGVVFLSLGAAPAGAADTPAPTSVTLAGSLQSELGCSADWQPLQAFINQARAFANAGILTPEQAGALSGEARSIVAQAAGEED